MFSPGIDGFTFDDLYQPAGLERLFGRFCMELRALSPDVAIRYDAYRAALAAGRARGGLTAPQESDLLVEVAAFTSKFISRLFRIDRELGALKKQLTGELGLFDFKREFITRRVFKKGAGDRPKRDELPQLDGRMALLLALGFGAELPPVPEGHPHHGPDHERALAEAVLTLMNVERHFAGQKEAQALVETWTRIRTAMLSTDAGKAAFGSTLVGDELVQVRGLLSLADRWTYARASFTHTFEGWSTIHQPKPLVFDSLVELKTPNSQTPEVFEGPDAHLRRRDGFGLTDPRFTPREVMNEVDYCVVCHEREKDSCSKGIKEKDPIAAGNTFKKNPLGVPLAGCPLEEHISEMHVLKGRGDSLGALTMVMLDNPMCPGTGHRICNDCMKACIFQKQEPVNIPQIETSTLTDVLAMPYGFEIYGLLTRWNPLNARRPYAATANGKNVMIVGLGPAGYTLSHYLLHEGFTVAGIDGLKIEPFPDALTGKNGHALTPIRDWKEIASTLDTRILEGFGGVSEYGITVRWDKSFLTLIHLTLARREGFKAYGGIRFGGTLTVDDAWAMGVDHIAIAAGAGKPTLVPMKNNLLRGVRAASDFLMALQLTGAFKKDSLANMQVRLPAIVIGGGLTGIDTATELFAYYPVQVEKVLSRHESLAGSIGEDAVFAKLNPEELDVYREFLEHGRAIRAERERAAKAHEAPDFVPLVRSWGGVSLCYRRSLAESPAYRLNHEEVAEALEEGIRFIERVTPVEAVPDEFGAVKALKFERMAVSDGKLKATGTFYELPARTVCVAAGTAPNVTYEREYPGTFKLAANGSVFRSHVLEEVDGALVLREAPEHSDIGRDTGFFTSYEKHGRFVTYYGDNHPTYNGNVVRAMASARDGYPSVVQLFAKELAAQRDVDQPSRDAGRTTFFQRLDSAFLATVEAVNRLTPTIVEVIVRAPYAAQHFLPGQFYRLQNFERTAPIVEGTRLTMEGLALTGAWVDKEKGLMSTIVLEMGASSRMCAMLQVGEPVVLMGPTGAPTEIPHVKETVLLAGGGLGNAVLFSIGAALRAAGCRVLYFAGYRRAEDAYKFDELEASADQVIWAVDAGTPLLPRRPKDRHFVGNIVQAMVAYAEGRLETREFDLKTVDRIIAIGSDRMMNAVKNARHGVLKPFLKPEHCAIGSINSPMQCMMKEICAQCLQRHVDPRTGKESFVFSCSNQDQPLDSVDFTHLDMRLRANSVLEKQADLFFAHLLRRRDGLLRV
ncbi:MAG: FAD-dependent oxidoreductase [Myxococcales bacterium]|nr:FAD-dependent oxidoreductase [Myxococcales bacterium]